MRDKESCLPLPGRLLWAELDPYLYCSVGTKVRCKTYSVKCTECSRAVQSIKGKCQMTRGILTPLLGANKPKEL